MIFRKNWTYFLTYLLYWLSAACINPYLGIFYSERGLNGMQIGVLGAVSSIITLPAALFLGPLADKTEKPKHILFILLISTIAFLGLIYGAHGFAMLLPIVALYGLCTSPVNDIVDTMLMHRIRSKPEWFGRFRLGGSVGFCIGTMISGFLISRYPQSILFTASGAGFFLTGIAIAVTPKSAEAYKTATTKQQDGEPWYKKLSIAAKNRAFVPAFVSLVVWGISESGVTQFLSLHVVGNHLAAEYTSLFIGAAMIGELIFFIFSTVVIKRMGPIFTMATGFLIQAARLISLSCLHILPISIITGVQFIGGGAFALIYSADTQYITIEYQGSIAFTAQALKSIANRGIGVTIGALVYGLFHDVSSTNTAFLSMGVLSLLYTLVLFSRAIIRKDFRG